MRPAGIFAPNSNTCFTKIPAYEKGNQKITPEKGKTNKSLTKQNTVHYGQNTTNKPFNFSKQSDYKLLKLTTMKKQILILFVSLFFGFMGAYGQMVQNSAPRPLSCTTGPLNPVAGVPYDYSALVDPAGGNAYWFATYNNTTFMSGSALTANQELIGGDFVSAATNYRDAATVAPATTTTNITWNSLGLATVTDTEPLFVVLHYTAPTTACADNLKVFRIDPVNAFLVNVLNLGSTYGTEVSSCFSDMASASYDLANSCVTYNYGENTLAYEVVAANFTGGYTPSFRVDGIQAGQSVEIFYDYDNDITGAISAGTLTADGVITLAAPVSTTATNTSLGVSLYVWLVIDNGTYEGINDTPITFAAAGENLAGEPNVRWNDCTIEVDITADLADANAPDYGVHTLNARPEVITNTTNAAGDTQNFEVPCTP